MNVIRGLEHLCCEDRLKRLKGFQLEQRRLWRDCIGTFQLKGAYRKNGEAFYTSM